LLLVKWLPQKEEKKGTIIKYHVHHMFLSKQANSSHILE
jgi:hypothetical protein